MPAVSTVHETRAEQQQDSQPLPAGDLYRDRTVRSRHHDDLLPSHALPFQARAKEPSAHPAWSAG